MNYFKDCKTQEEAKKKFRELAMKLHPDHGGKKEDMIELQRQYEAFGTHDFNRMKESFNKGYTAYGSGGYQYKNTNDMRSEYFKQQNDPRIADYEYMKNKYHEAMSIYQHNLKENQNQRWENNRLKDENEKLKKKLERIKKKLNPVSKPPSKRKKKDSESVISL